ncbi:MAG: glyceraldehyde 3-phosphate dehydrogenase NAD-binding domain-containing protein [Pseudomonadota bacterium]
MSYRIAINGLGRIGRCVLRAFFESNDHDGLEIVALNELADIQTLAHLTRYDSTHGKFAGAVEVDGAALIINGKRLAVSNVRELQSLTWREQNIDLVMECTGSFSDRATAELHLKSGAGRVLLSQPAAAAADVDATIVYGVNHQTLRPQHKLVSNASCTTNCIVPVIQALHNAVGIEHGVLTTIHSAMNDQPVLDAYHHTDLRKTRSAMHSIIPVDTGLARGIDRLLPELAGRFEAQAMRVPTMNVSAIDLSVVVTKAVDRDAINAMLQAAARAYPPGVLGCTSEPLASCDFNHDLRSGIVDLSQTRVSGKHLVKVLVWFDNEWAFANRMLDVAKLLGQLPQQ